MEKLSRVIQVAAKCNLSLKTPREHSPDNILILAQWNWVRASDLWTHERIMCAVLSHQVSGLLLQQGQETNTQTHPH